MSDLIERARAARYARKTRLDVVTVTVTQEESRQVWQALAFIPDWPEVQRRMPARVKAAVQAEQQRLVKAGKSIAASAALRVQS